MKTLAFRLALVFALVMGLGLIGTGGGDLLSPSPDQIATNNPPCDPYGPGLCSLTSYGCFNGTCCCHYRTDCDAYQGGSVCFPE